MYNDTISKPRLKGMVRPEFNVDISHFVDNDFFILLTDQFLLKRRISKPCLIGSTFTSFNPTEMLDGN